MTDILKKIAHVIDEFLYDPARDYDTRRGIGIYYGHPKQEDNKPIVISNQKKTTPMSHQQWMEPKNNLPRNEAFVYYERTFNVWCGDNSCDIKTSCIEVEAQKGRLGGCPKILKEGFEYLRSDEWKRNLKHTLLIADRDVKRNSRIEGLTEEEETEYKQKLEELERTPFDFEAWKRRKGVFSK